MNYNVDCSRRLWMGVKKSVRVILPLNPVLVRTGMIAVPCSSSGWPAAQHNVRETSDMTGTR